MKRLETIAPTSQVGIDNANKICYRGFTVIAFAPLVGDWSNLSTISAFRRMKNFDVVRIAMLIEGQPEGELDGRLDSNSEYQC